MMPRTRLVVLLALAAAVPSAMQAALGNPAIANGLPRVRALDAPAGEVLQTAVRLSPTVVRLIAELKDGDVIVHVLTGVLPPNVNGITQLVTAKPYVRYVRIVLKIPNPLPRLIEVLGHELQHVVEIAANPQVRDQLSFAAASTLIGWPTQRGGFFETSAAIQTGRQVWLELTRR